MIRLKLYVIVLSIKQRENKDFGTAAGVKAETTEHLFHRLHLEGRQHNKLRAADVLQITKHSLQSHESCAEEELIQTFIQKLLMMNYRARYIITKRSMNRITHSKGNITHLKIRVIFTMTFSSLMKKTSQYERIHPMDVQMAVFHCADGFLKQLMVTKCLSVSVRSASACS